MTAPLSETVGVSRSVTDLLQEMRNPRCTRFVAAKSNILRAIRLLLDDTMVRAAFRLEESDFCRSLGEWGEKLIYAPAPPMDD